MALIRCPECNREISDKATACPGCGYPLQDHTEEVSEKERLLKEAEEKDKQFIKKAAVIMTTGVIVMLALIFVLSRVV